MRLINRLQLRAERGFSMFLAIMAMAVTSMFVAAAFVAVNGDLPVSGTSKDRKAAYAAAEAGLAFYLNHLQRDPDYWTLCTDVPAPNDSEPSPVNQQWNGGGADPRTWRTIQDSDSQYTIELLHTDGYEAADKRCMRTDQKSMIDERTGKFKIRFTGRPSATSNLRRSIVATFQRESFLNFVYFTEYETGDPEAAASSTTRSRLQANCADRVRSRRTHDDCAANEITFPTGDEINGPLHTNDESVRVCGVATFGRTQKTEGGPVLTKRIDTIEVRGPLPGYVHPSGGCSVPIINTPTNKFTPFAKYVPIPVSNDKLAEVARNNGEYYTGKTIIHLKGNVMDVTTHDGGTAVKSTNVALPANGVIYVDAEGSCSNTDVPIIATYNESSGCGNVYVSGTYAKSLTIAARRDIIIRPTVGAVLDSSSDDADLLASGDVTLGLVADNFVRVGRKVTRGSGCSDVAPVVRNVEIEAAILSTKHSFTVDNNDCGKLGTLTVNGAIAQKYRGVVSRFSGATVVSGFAKNYWYDDRLRYRSPPYFLDPVKSAWGVQRIHEQVPAR
jgi:hypothetical protein